MRYYYITNPDGTPYKNGRGQFLTQEMVEEYKQKGYTLKCDSIYKEGG